MVYMKYMKKIAWYVKKAFKTLNILQQTRHVCMYVHKHVLSHFGHVQLYAAPWTVAHQAPLSREFSTQEYWSGLPCPSSGNLPDPGTEPTSLMPPALAGRFFTASAMWEALRRSQRLSDLNGAKSLPVGVQWQDHLPVAGCICNLGNEADY